MPAWAAWAIPGLIDIGMGILGAGGQKQTNEANARMAREQMDFQQKSAREQMAFQERMSSTSAQRSIEDYRRAGLNPALAYERGASSPGGASGSGASAVMGNVTEAGISNARGMAQLRQQMKQSAEQHSENLRLIRAQADKTQQDKVKGIAETEAAIGQSRLYDQALRFNATNQPWETRMKAADTVLREAMIPGARNTATFEEMMGAAGKGLFSAKTAAEILKMLRGGGK